MKQNRWTGSFSYSAATIDWDSKWKDIFHPNLHRIIGDVSISHLSVSGGADRKIELARTDDMSLTSELEQAKLYKNIRLFLVPQSSFAGADIMQIALNEMIVDVQVHLSCETNERTPKGLIFQAKFAKIKETPRKLSDSLKNQYLFVNLGFMEATLEFYRPEGKELVFHKW